MAAIAGSQRPACPGAGSHCAPPVHATRKCKGVENFEAYRLQMYQHTPVPYQSVTQIDRRGKHSPADRLAVRSQTRVPALRSIIFFGIMFNLCFTLFSIQHSDSGYFRRKARRGFCRSSMEVRTCTSESLRTSTFLQFHPGGGTAGRYRSWNPIPWAADLSSGKWCNSCTKCILEPWLGSGQTHEVPAAGHRAPHAQKQAGLPARGHGESLQKGTCKMSSAT